ncbi:hemerythrin domain-containing protein [Variovorax humicola]|uniref:Hemerythrin domain-containing protein n=1 Tax=Variovorax humicola TaxID=1769758 RepID=A0ABU8VXJ9_9BURK
MNAVNDFSWDDRYLVGHQAMDDTHKEFVDLVEAMLCADETSFASAIDSFAIHLEEHFESERRLMDQYGFPARDCHIEEHDRVLASVREVRALVANGDAETGRELTRALADWFPGHTDYMDSALATWVSKKVANGAPVVLRRSMRRHAAAEATASA